MPGLVWEEGRGLRLGIPGSAVLLAAHSSPLTPVLGSVFPRFSRASGCLGPHLAGMGGSWEASDSGLTALVLGSSRCEGPEASVCEFSRVPMATQWGPAGPQHWAGAQGGPAAQASSDFFREPSR